MQFISFAIGDDQYGVDIMAVREIKGWSDDHAFAAAAGICARRAQPAWRHRADHRSALSLRARKTDATPLHIAIIVQSRLQLVGLLADRVLDIVSLDGANIQPVPHLVQAARVTFLAGLVTVDNFMIALIDLANLLSAQAEAEGLSAIDAKSPPLAPAPSAQPIAIA